MNNNITKKEHEKLRKIYVEYHLKELTDELYKTLEDPKYSAASILNRVEELKPNLTAKEYMDIRMKVHKLIHGEKLNIHTTNEIIIKGYENVSPDSFPAKVINVKPEKKKKK